MTLTGNKLIANSSLIALFLLVVSLCAYGATDSSVSSDEDDVTESSASPMLLDSQSGSMTNFAVPGSQNSFCPQGAREATSKNKAGYSQHWCELSGKKVGPYESYYSNGNKQSEYRFSDGGVPHGEYTQWHSNGTKIKSGKIKEGKLQGFWQRWYEDGKLETEGEWESDLAEGEWRYYDKSGALKEVRQYHLGKVIPQSALSSRFLLLPGLQYSNITFAQTNIPEFSETALTLKLLGLYHWSPRWDLQWNFSYTALPFSSSDHFSSIKFLETHLSAGYLLTTLGPSWKIHLVSGLSLHTSFSAPDEFGFQGYFSPHVYPRFSKYLSGGRVAWVSLKYIPLGAFFNFTNTELAVSAGYPLFSWKESKPVQLILDYLSLKISGPDGGVINTSSYSLGVSFSL